VTVCDAIAVNVDEGKNETKITKKEISAKVVNQANVICVIHSNLFQVN